MRVHIHCVYTSKPPRITSKGEHILSNTLGLGPAAKGGSWVLGVRAVHEDIVAGAQVGQHRRLSIAGRPQGAIECARQPEQGMAWLPWEVKCKVNLGGGIVRGCLSIVDHAVPQCPVDGGPSVVIPAFCARPVM